MYDQNREWEGHENASFPQKFCPILLDRVPHPSPVETSVSNETCVWRKHVVSAAQSNRTIYKMATFQIHTVQHISTRCMWLMNTWHWLVQSRKWIFILIFILINTCAKWLPFCTVLVYWIMGTQKKDQKPCYKTEKPLGMCVWTCMVSTVN